MKITNNDLINEFMPALTELSNTKITKHKIQYALLKTIKKANSAVKEYNEGRKAILENAAIKGEDDKPLTKTEKNSEDKEVQKYVYESKEVEDAAIAEVQKLFEMEIDLMMHEVSIKEFEGVAIEPIVLSALRDFIIE